MGGSDSPFTNPLQSLRILGCSEISKKKYHDRLQTYHNQKTPNNWSLKNF